MSYTTPSQISNFLNRSLTTYESGELGVIIDAVKVWIDKRLNSTFDQATPTTRYYDGGVKNLDIDPCTAITEVKSVNDDASSSYTYTADYEYVAEPQNETVKRELRKRLSAFPRGIHRVAVTATFSEYDNGVPADIQIVATRLAAGVINAGKWQGTGATAHREQLEGHMIQYQLSPSTFLGLAEDDPTVKAILAARADLLVDNDEPNREVDYDDDNAGLMI